MPFSSPRCVLCNVPTVTTTPLPDDPVERVMSVRKRCSNDTAKISIRLEIEGCSYSRDVGDEPRIQHLVELIERSVIEQFIEEKSDVFLCNSHAWLLSLGRRLCESIAERFHRSVLSKNPGTLAKIVGKRRVFRRALAEEDLRVVCG
jgi:hypothetical protein